MTDNEFVLEMKNITKSYSGNIVLDNVNLEVRRGEVHAIIGANGAGKSTLVKILDGIVQSDSGEIILDQNIVDIKNVHDAQTLGISMVSQELSLVPMLSVGENIFLNREPKSKPIGLVDAKNLLDKANQLLQDCGFSLDPKSQIADLTVSDRQLVEIARAVSFNAEIIIMDEPTSSLTAEETKNLFSIIEDLKENGKTILYISHRLEEVFSLCDRVTVLRGGKLIGVVERGNYNIPVLVNMMMGEQTKLDSIEMKRELGEEVLRIRNISRKGTFHDISFDIKEGEIVGLAGLVGSGRTEILKAIFGVSPPTEGEILINGKSVKINNTKQAIENGIFLVPEDRNKEGLIEDFTVRHNITLASLSMLFRVFIHDRKEDKIAKNLVDTLDITPARTNIIGRFLSGGNQQKVVVSRALCIQPKILLLDEITKGVDVKAKGEIYHLIKELVYKEGVGVLLTSVELAELIEHCDRIIALHNKEVVTTFTKEDMSEEKVLTAMFGG